MVRSLSELFRFRFSGEQSASQGPDRPGVGAGAGLEQALALGPFSKIFRKIGFCHTGGPLPRRGEGFAGWPAEQRRGVAASKSHEIRCSRTGAEAEDEDRPPEPGSGLRPFGDSFPS